MSKFKTMVWLAGFGFASALAAHSVNGVAAQAPSDGPVAEHQHQAAPLPPSTLQQDQGSTKMEQNMMVMRQRMMANQKASNARLQPLIDTMNAAKGEAKVDAMAAALTELVHQQSEQMMTMPGMMGMMQGMSEEMRKLAAQCPMMKGPGDTPPKP